jgi:hypothetical protein
VGRSRRELIRRQQRGETGPKNWGTGEKHIPAAAPGRFPPVWIFLFFSIFLLEDFFIFIIFYFLSFSLDSFFLHFYRLFLSLSRKKKKGKSKKRFRFRSFSFLSFSLSFAFGWTDMPEWHLSFRLADTGPINRFLFFFFPLNHHPLHHQHDKRCQTVLHIQTVGIV